MEADLADHLSRRRDPISVGDGSRRPLDGPISKIYTVKTNSSRELLDLGGIESALEELLLENLNRGVPLTKLGLELSALLGGPPLKFTVGGGALVALDALAGLGVVLGRVHRVRSFLGSTTLLQVVEVRQYRSL